MDILGGSFFSVYYIDMRVSLRVTLEEWGCQVESKYVQI